jgi:uncharacterized membrane protein
MDEQTTVIAGIVVPSVSPVFLSIVAVHIVIALTAVVAGVVAMLSQKGAGIHVRFGTIYFWSLFGVFVSATALSFMRWPENRHLFFIGAAAFLLALVARTAARARWHQWARIHLIAMGSSYIALLVAFYVDNGRNLPLWRELPSVTYWLIPVAAGVALIARTLLRHPLTRVAPRTAPPHH